jgi:hypothetical protein
MWPGRGEERPPFDSARAAGEDHEPGLRLAPSLEERLVDHVRDEHESLRAHRQVHRPVGVDADDNICPRDRSPREPVAKIRARRSACTAVLGHRVCPRVAPRSDNPGTSHDVDGGDPSGKQALAVHELDVEALDDCSRPSPPGL